MNGIINVYKEQGFTSHDVVAKLRGILKMKKIGHTGTLDPDAVGVLPVCLGKATKICDMITDWSKTYEAEFVLGIRTDTLDMSGKVLYKNEVNVSELDILDVCNTFVGEYSQIPPMYSALKVNGKKLYELARQGIEVERKPRTVHIESLHINDIDLSDDEKTVRITVECSKGTYIRTLCDDIGLKLGCGATMKRLTRTRVGEFKADDTLTLNQITALMIKGELNNYIYPIENVFSKLDKLNTKEEFNYMLYNGNKIPYEAFDSDIERKEGDRFRVYDSMGVFVGVFEALGNYLKPEKMFYEA